MYSNDRIQLRKVYMEAWRKANDQELLSPLEDMMARVISVHPEYQYYFNDDNVVDKDFTVDSGETNPFLHISLHMAVREQIANNQPSGIADIYHHVCHTLGDAHEAEHALMRHLAELIGEIAKGKSELDERQYIASLKEHLIKQGLKP